MALFGCFGPSLESLAKTREYPEYDVVIWFYYELRINDIPFRADNSLIL